MSRDVGRGKQKEKLKKQKKKVLDDLTRKPSNSDGKLKQRTKIFTEFPEKNLRKNLKSRESIRRQE